MNKITKQLLTGVVALGILAPTVAPSLNPTRTTVNASRHRRRTDEYRAKWYMHNARRVERKYRHSKLFKRGSYDTHIIWPKLQRKYVYNRAYRQGWIIGRVSNMYGSPHTSEYRNAIWRYDNGHLYFQHHRHARVIWLGVQSWKAHHYDLG